jgi:cysteine-rich repeat protein
MLRIATLAALCLAVTACSFDNSALSTRACESNDECAPGICLAGYCQQVADLADVQGDVDSDAIGDADADVGHDAGDIAADTSSDSGDAGQTTCEDTPSCDGTVLVICDEEGDVFRVDCDDSPECDSVLGCTCQGGGCVDRICEPESTRCNDGGQVQTCFADGLAWSAPVVCDAGTTCAEGECVETSCEPGATVCSGETLVVCDDDGAPAESRNCAASDLWCDDSTSPAACEPRTCEPGVVRCGEDGQRLACADNGSTESAVEACDDDERCDGGFCVPTSCEANDRSCLDSFSVGICNATGTELTVQPCEAGSYCDVASARCVTQDCEPDSSRCLNGTTVEVCNSLGSDYGAPLPCPTDTSCVGGTCVDRVCTPGARFCDDDANAAVCNESGTALASVNECPFVCADGSCQESRCGDGILEPITGETCDDSNTRACDGCHQCAVQNVLSLAPGTSTSSTTFWVPGESNFTVEFWLRTTSATTHLVGIGDTNNRDFFLSRLEGGLPIFVGRVDDGEEIFVRGNTRVDTGLWTHVAFVRTSSDGGRILVNGELVGFTRRDLDARSLDSTSGRIWVGSEGRVAMEAFEMDELRISNNARYGERYAPQLRFTRDANTIALYHFDESTGRNAADDGGTSSLSFTAAGWLPETCAGATAGELCGDRVVAAWEGCDDGNLEGGDGCSPACRVERRCAIGIERPGATEGGCYFGLPQAMPWGDAVRTCETFGATNLATINNADENAWLLARFASPFWIGFNDIDAFFGTGPFEWRAGSSSFTNWAPGEPNDGGAFSAEDCTWVGADGRWNDFDCNGSYIAVCEYPF